jgi:hypothetical protein
MPRSSALSTARVTEREGSRTDLVSFVDYRNARPARPAAQVAQGSATRVVSKRHFFRADS